ncbi:hypothetical protein LS71_006705 [Helicobacter jaachi]|uniref:Uncharacterized protein n=1 Tax=Helicobacter jaachi TaxID=1677920 RepID=A0A4U8T986_9HELI|nr:hypothetical protein [Helicobacter jaachi]TLD96164.1 hypothetical protein LS71_006705 [Helicobacter jaachi]
MLDSMQNTILNKPDSIIEKRPNSPMSEVSKLESKFENMFAKKAQEAQADKSPKDAKEVKDAKTKPLKSTEKKVEAKAKGVEGAQVNKAKQPNNAQNVAQSVNAQKEGDLLAQSLQSNKTQSNAKAAPSAFDFKDSASEDSKIGLQEKIAKSSKEAKPKEHNPLVEALSAPLSQTNNAQAKAKQELAQKLAPMPAPQASKAIEESADKTLKDVENLAKAKNLNPSKLSVQSTPAQNAPLAQSAQEPEAELAKLVPQKPKGVPSSAKERINYEYENNTDRIAIVQRGTKKPKNITSKINNEYPVKKADNEASSALPLKDIAR